MRFLPIFFIFFLQTNLTAATVISLQNGNWTDKNTWEGGQLPTPGDEIIIKHQLQKDGDLNLEEAYLFLEDNGNLIISGDVNVKGFSSLTIGQGSILSCQNFKNYTLAGALAIDGKLICTGDQATAGLIDLGGTGILDLSGDISCSQLIISGNFEFMGQSGTIKVSKDLQLLGNSKFSLTQNSLQVEGNLFINSTKPIKLESSVIDILQNLYLESNSHLFVDSSQVKVSSFLNLKNEAQIILRKRGTLTANSVQISGTSKISGTGTGGLLKSRNWTILDNANVTCVNGDCTYNKNSFLDIPANLDLGQGISIVTPGFSSNYKVIQPNNLDIQIFPNPTVDFIQIKGVDQLNHSANISVVNNIGTLVQVASNELEDGMIPLKNYGSPGLYSIIIKTDSQTITKKILLQ